MKTVEHTLSIIKPDAVRRALMGPIYTRLTAAGLQIVGVQLLQLDRSLAQGFYAEHQDKGFFPELVDYMVSGPVLVQVLAGSEAIRRYRELMGATNPAQALTGTLRADYGISLQENAVHGSDSLTSAAREVAYFFKAREDGFYETIR